MFLQVSYLVIVLYKSVLAGIRPHVLALTGFKDSWMSSMKLKSGRLLLRENCPHSELFFSLFHRIRTEYREIRSIFPYSI